MGVETRKNIHAPKSLYLINRDFQFRFAGAALLVGTVTTVLTLFVILFPLYQFKILKIANFLPTPIMAVMLIAVLLNAGVVWISGIFVTHKVAGPVFSMTRQFRRVGQGKWFGRMGLRKGDELKFLVRNFNDMLEQMEKVGGADYMKISKILDLLEDGTQEKGERIEQAVTELKSYEQTLQKRFNLP